MQLQACSRINYRCAKKLSMQRLRTRSSGGSRFGWKTERWPSESFLQNWAFKGLLNYLILNWGCVVRRSSRFGLLRRPEKDFSILNSHARVWIPLIKFLCRIRTILFCTKIVIFVSKVARIFSSTLSFKQSHKNKIGKGGWTQKGQP